MKIVIIGGGITGLATAHRILEISKEKALSVSITILEKSEKLGGVISTRRVENCLIEEGSDAIFTEKPWALNLAKRLGLENELIQTNPKCRKSFVLFQGKLHPVPEGFYLLAPSKMIPFLFSSILSVPGKFRALSEIFLPAENRGTDESLASFVKRRFGNELFERLAQPMVAGIYSADPEELSLAATFPKFLELEQNYGSVIKGMMKKRKTPSAESSASGPRYSLFVSFKSGMQTLVEKLVERLQPCTIRMKTEVKNIRYKQPKEPSKGFIVECQDFSLEADEICLAVPSFTAADIVKNLDAELSANLFRISYRSGISVNFIYHRRDVGNALEGFGYVVPELENKIVSGCTFSSVKFLGRATEDKVVLRAFIGGKRAEPLLAEEDQKIFFLAKKEVSETLNIKGEPICYQVSRHPLSLPQYKVGHQEKVREIKERLKFIPGITLAGNAYDGTGIPDCIHSAELSAEQILNT